MIVTVATCECGEAFRATFHLHFVPREIEYRLLDHSLERHLLAGHEVTFTKTGRLTYSD